MAQQPMYLQIAESIRQQIDGGKLQDGDQLPTELDLRSAHNASRNTIRDAIKRLAALGLVETRPGQGTFVTIKSDPWVTIMSGDPNPANAKGSVDPESTSYLSAVAEEHRKVSKSKPKLELQKPPEPVRLRLRIGEEDEVIVRHEQRFSDGGPWSLLTSFYPMDLVTKKGASRLLSVDDIPEGTVQYLATVGVHQTSYRDWITARAPDEDEQKFFHIAHSVWVFALYRTGFDQDKQPMRVTVSIFPADRNQFIYDEGDPPEPKYG